MAVQGAERGAGSAGRIRTLVPEGMVGVMDGSARTAEWVPAIRGGGTLVELRGWPGPAERGIRVCPVMVPDRVGDTVSLDIPCRQAETGVLTPRVAAVLPAAEAARAHRLLEDGGLRGRVAPDFSRTP
ncbi:hypothetical protein [Streptomyces sp. NPDC055099]